MTIAMIIPSMTQPEFVVMRNFEFFWNVAHSKMRWSRNPNIKQLFKSNDPFVWDHER